MAEVTRDRQIKGLLRKGGKSFFPVSWLYLQAYCEMQLYLDKFKRLYVPATKAMIRGAKIHKQLEDAHAAAATEVMDISEAFAASKERDIAVVFREIDVFGNSMYGIIDELWITPDNVIVIDDKPHNTAYPSQIRQVMGYSLAFDEEHEHNRNIVCQLRNRTSGRVFWQEDFSEEGRNDVLNVVERIQKLIQGEEEFQTADNPEKCRSCRFRNHCSKSRYDEMLKDYAAEVYARMTKNG
jgi:CRISPR-associated exonuclease Cas4